MAMTVDVIFKEWYFGVEYRKVMKLYTDVVHLVMFIIINRVLVILESLFDILQNLELHH